MHNRFGVILAGSHPELLEMTRTLVKHAKVLHISAKQEDFYTTESGLCLHPNVEDAVVERVMLVEKI